MNRKLYYCEYWCHRKINKFDVCISDLIYYKSKKNLQIHLIAMCNSLVIRTSRIDEVNMFEKQIREYFRKKFKWSDGINELVVKIWYYNEDNKPIQENDIPLRIAITVLGLETSNYVKETTIINELYIIFVNLLERLY